MANQDQRSSNDADRANKMGETGCRIIALEEMDHNGVNQLPVMANGQMQGMLTREDVITYLRTLQELGI